MIGIIKKFIGFILLLIFSLNGSIDRMVQPEVAQEQDKKNEEKLFVAINTENEQALIEAVREGADINKFENFSNGTVSPLIWSIHESNYNNRFNDTLLSYDFDPDFVDLSGTTVFYELIDEDNKGFYKLLSLGPNLNYIDKNKNNAINKFILSKDYDFFPRRIKLLIDNGATVQKKNINTIIGKIKFGAINEEDKIPGVNVLKHLIDNYNGKDIDKDICAAYKGTFNEKNKCKNNIVLYGIAGYCGNDILRANINENSDLNLLLRIAVMANNIENVKFLIEKGASVKDEPNLGYENALSYAVNYGNYETAEYLIPLYKEAVDKCLLFAVREKDYDFVNFLLDNGANVNNKEAFEEAFFHDDEKMVNLFVDRGFVVNQTVILLHTSYMVCAFNYYKLDTIKNMYKYSKKLSQEEIQEAMYNSIDRGDLEVLKFLKELGADFSIEYISLDGTKYESQFMTAVRNGFFDITKFLVENGCTLDNYSDEEVNEFIRLAKESNDIYNYLVNKKIIPKG